MDNATITTHEEIKAILVDSNRPLFLSVNGTSRIAEVVDPEVLNNLHTRILDGSAAREGSVSLTVYGNGCLAVGDDMSTLSHVLMYEGCGYCARDKLVGLLRSPTPTEHGPVANVELPGTPFNYDYDIEGLCTQIENTDPGDMEVRTRITRDGILCIATLPAEMLRVGGVPDQHNGKYTNVVIRVLPGHPQVL